MQLLSLGKAGDGMMKAEGADRALEVMGGDWKGVRASAALARLVGQIEYHLVQVVLEGLILGVLFVELDAGLQAGRYLLLQGRVVLDPGVLAVGVHLSVPVRLVLVHPAGHDLEDISHLVGVAERVPPGLVELVQYRG